VYPALGIATRNALPRALGVDECAAANPVVIHAWSAPL
jgi:hypothetical protein